MTEQNDAVVEVTIAKDPDSNLTTYTVKTESTNITLTFDNTNEDARHEFVEIVFKLPELLAMVSKKALGELIEEFVPQ
jgi:hypothetical protein